MLQYELDSSLWAFSCTGWLWWFLQGTGALLCFQLAAVKGMLEHRTVLLYLGASPRWQRPAHILLWEADRKIGVRKLKLKRGVKLKIRERRRMWAQNRQTCSADFAVAGSCCQISSQQNCLPAFTFMWKGSQSTAAARAGVCYRTVNVLNQKEIGKDSLLLCLLGLWGNKTRSLLP